MKTGIDISLAECRVSGYPVVEHGKRPLDPEKDYLLTISDPRSWNDNGKAMIGFPTSDLYRFNGMVTYQHLWERFESQGDGIKSYCDFKNCPFPSPDEEPSYHDFVLLAETLDGYCGIE